MSLSEIIIQRIKQSGPISFRDFMDMSLYYPGLGYYTSCSERIGEQGDYYTSPYLTNLFGIMMARQIEQMWQAINKQHFTIVEYGAGTGALCYDILSYLKKNSNIYETLDYYIIEKSPAMRQKEQKVLDEKVKWANSITDIPPFSGCVISNELVDNFPVHQVVMQEQLMEVVLDYADDFVEKLQPACAELKEYLQALDICLPYGYRTEINLHAIKWQEEIAAAVRSGFVLTVDYGYSSTELYRNYRSMGTVACYHKHHVHDNPYRNIGSQDITSHVNFSALKHWGLKNGLCFCGFTDQAHFLLGAGLTEYLRKAESTENNGMSVAQKAFLIHNLLVEMGSKIHVLAQYKGIPQPQLSGLSFCKQLN